MAVLWLVGAVALACLPFARATQCWVDSSLCDVAEQRWAPCEERYVLGGVKYAVQILAAGCAENTWGQDGA